MCFCRVGIAHHYPVNYGLVVGNAHPANFSTSSLTPALSQREKAYSRQLCLEPILNNAT